MCAVHTSTPLPHCICGKHFLAVFPGHPLALGRGASSKLWAPQQMLSLFGHRKPVNPVTVDSRSICAVRWASLDPLQSNSVFPHSLLLLWHFCFWRHLPYTPLFSCVGIWHLFAQGKSFFQYWCFWLNCLNLTAVFSVVVLLLGMGTNALCILYFDKPYVSMIWNGVFFSPVRKMSYSVVFLLRH